VLDVGSDYFAGRRGRCFAEIDLMMSRPLPRGSIGTDARRSDSVISARTAGVDRSAEVASLTSASLLQRLP